MTFTNTPLRLLSSLPRTFLPSPHPEFTSSRWPPPSPAPISHPPAGLSLPPPRVHILPLVFSFFLSTQPPDCPTPPLNTQRLNQRHKYPSLPASPANKTLTTNKSSSISPGAFCDSARRIVPLHPAGRISVSDWSESLKIVL